MSRRLDVALLAIVLLVVGRPVEAGNRYTYFVGGRAAGMAGAFTAFGTDGSAAWYNPAALSLQERHSFSLSASAYGFEIFDIDGMVRTQLGGETHSSDYSSTSLSIVPTSMDTVYRLSDADADTRHVLALSVLVPTQRDIAQTFEFNEESFAYHQKFTLKEKFARYYVGPSYGVGLGDHVSLGASLFVVYDQYAGSSGVYFHIDQSAGEVPRDWFAVLDTNVDTMSFGVIAAAAIHLRFGGWRIGAQVRSPIFGVYSSSDVTEVEALVDPITDPSQTSSDFRDEEGSSSSWSFTVRSPTSIALGLGYEVPGRWRVGIDVIWHSTYESKRESVYLRNTVNVALGAEVFVTETIPLSFGFFTDFHPENRMVQFGARQVDYYGGTFAVSFLSPYDVVGSEKTKRITFSSTVGVHYAYGFGEAVGLLHVLDGDNPFQLTKRPLTGHDVHVFLASTVRF